MVRPPIDAALLPELLEYDPETGVLTWKERGPEWFKTDADARKWNSRFAGQLALSCINDAGYLHGAILGISTKAHRAAWALETGKWPEEDIDHINGDRSDNRFSNLRKASREENNQNSTARSGSTSRYLGVCWDKRITRWRATITYRRQHNYLGHFDTEEEAFAAYCAAKQEMHSFNPVPREVQHGLV